MDKIQFFKQGTKLILLSFVESNQIKYTLQWIIHGILSAVFKISSEISFNDKEE